MARKISMTQILSFFILIFLLFSNFVLLPKAKADFYQGRAFDSLTACINRETTKFVNIIFLVDSSASLRKQDGGSEGSGSDPDDLRAGMVRSAIETLKDLNNPNTRKVSFAVTTFDRESPGRGQDGKPLPNFDWTEATPENVQRAAEWTEKIKKFDYGQATDWVKGLSNAKRELLERAPGKAEDRCHAIIWFTDGALDVVAGDENELGAIEALCGTVPGQSGIPKDSVMAEIRRANIHLIGLLLSPKNPSESTKRLISLLYPAVLGQPNPDAPISTKNFNCGGPIPDSQGQGYYIEVKDTDQLSREFVGMINEIVFGKKTPITCTEGDASFVLDKGLERLVVFLPSQNWQIKLPKNEILTPSSVIPRGATRIIVQDKFYQWTFDASNSNIIGSWTINSDECPSVFLNSGLLPRLASSNSSLVAGKDNQSITGSIFKSSGGKPDLSLYQKVELEVEVLDSSEQSRKPRISRASINPSDASWQANVTPYEGSKLSNMVLKLRVTSASGRELPEIRVSTSLDLRYPEDFCSVVSEKITLSPLVPLKEPAVGNIKLAGPVSQGSTCQVSFKEFRITGDAKNRSASDFNIKLVAEDSKDLTTGQTLTLNSGESKDLKLSISDEVITEGKSRGLVILAIKSLTAPEEIEQSIVIDFENTPVGPRWWEILLISLIGIGLSLGLLYLSNFLYGRLRLKELRVANIPIVAEIKKGKVILIREDGRANLLEDKDFKYLEDDGDSIKKTINADGAGEYFAMDVVLPKNPFKDVRAVTTFLAGRKGFSSEELSLLNSGQTTPAPLNPDSFWVVSGVEQEKVLEDERIKLKAMISIYLSPADAAYQKIQFADISKQLLRNESSWSDLAGVLTEASPSQASDLGDSEEVKDNDLIETKREKKRLFGKSKGKDSGNQGESESGGESDIEKW